MSRIQPRIPRPVHLRAQVIVVGAGPAGAITARLLAQQGLDVLLLDRESFPRAKPCGDCLSAGATALLERLHLLDRVLAAPHARLAGWHVIAPDGGLTEGRFHATRALAVERAVFDKILVDAACEAGARLQRVRVGDLVRDSTGRRVVGVRGRGPDGGAIEIGAELVVGADGLRSTVARRLGAVRRTPRLRKLSLTAHIHAPDADRDQGEMHLLDGGCIGLAPIGQGRANLTLVVSHAHAAALREWGTDRFLRHWMDQSPRVRARVGDPAIERTLASGPFDWPVRSAAIAGTALVGDAAGYFDPFTGQGIHHGMLAAEMLAGLVGPAVAAGQVGPALAAYARAHRRLARPARRLQQGIEAVLSRPALADRALRRLARAPAVMDRLVAVTGDLAPPRSLISPALLSTFLFPARTEDR